jgi:hypothetical protein
MSQIVKKYIGNDQVDGSKFRGLNGDTIDFRNNADNADLPIIEVNSSDEVYVYSGTQGEYLKLDGANQIVELGTGGLILTIDNLSQSFATSTGEFLMEFDDVAVVAKLMRSTHTGIELNSSGLKLKSTSGSQRISCTASELLVGEAGAPGSVALTDLAGTGKVILKAPTSISPNVVFVLPAADGTANQVLATDGAGNLSWISPTGPTNAKQNFTLSAGDITNGYVDFSHEALLDSVMLVASGLVHIEGTDYTLNYTGGSGGNTRLTWTGSFGSGLVAGDVLSVQYQY